MRSSLLLILLTSAAVCPAEVFRYGRFEQGFTASKDFADPLKDVQVVVEFSGPGAAKQQVNAFWDGARTWKVRFSPEKAGSWKFRVATPGFSPSAGSFQATGYKGTNRLYKAGAPRLSSNRRYFVQADGTPWFWLSDTAWNGGLLSTREEWKNYLADRAAKKFTAVQFVMTQWRAGRKDEQGQIAFTVSDHLAINPEFFRRMDRKFDELNNQGLVAAPVLLWALASRDKESPGISLPDDQAALLAGYMVARYGAHHTIWILGGDGEYRGANAARWKSIGSTAFPNGRARHPVTLHPGGMKDPWPEYKDEPWVDFFMYQSGHGGDVRKWRWNATEGPAKGWKLEPPRPVIDGEPNYEGHMTTGRKVIDDSAVRRAAYYSLLAAPVAGVTYGAHGIWFWSRKAEVPLDHANTGIALPWTECLNYPGAKQMAVMREIFDSLKWWELRPDRTLLAEDSVDEGFTNYIMPARSEKGDAALIYLPANPSIKLNLTGFKKPVTANWINPTTGKRTPAGKFQPQPALELKTPAQGDWLLTLQ